MKMKTKELIRGDGIISRENEIKCTELVVTPLVVGIDGYMMGYITSMHQEGKSLIVNRSIPKIDRNGFEKITQKIESSLTLWR